MVESELSAKAAEARASRAQVVASSLIDDILSFCGKVGGFFSPKLLVCVATSNDGMGSLRFE
jgi:hypothetical protein